MTDFCEKRFPIEFEDQILMMPYCSNFSLDHNNEAITRVIIAFHGKPKEGESDPVARKYLRRCEKAVEIAETRLRLIGLSRQTLIVAPRFLREVDVPTTGPAGLLFWSRNPYWGAPSAAIWENGAGDPISQPFTISSYEVLDRMLDHVIKSGHFPHIRYIALIGHSAGGQLVQRYSAINQFEPRLTAPRNIAVRYIPMNAGSYMYFDNKRFVEGSYTRFARPSPERITACPNYDEYSFGLVNRRGYCAYVGESTDSVIRSRFRERDSVVLVGSNDLTEYEECQTNLQGRTNRDRGIIYHNHLIDSFGPEISLFHKMEIIPGIAHDGRQMMHSDSGIRYLFANYDEDRVTVQFSMMNDRDLHRFINPHIVHTKTGDNKELIVLSGCVIVNLRGEKDNQWRHEIVELSISITDILPPRKWLTLESWAPFVTINSVKDGIDRSGQAVDTFSLLNPYRPLAGSVTLRIKAAVRRSKARLYRLSYLITLVGEFIDQEPGPD